jgi:predicted MPP superfamily phosphohydrolase
LKLIDLLYTGDWPAKTVRRLGLQAPLRVREHLVAVPSIGGRDRLRVAYASDFHAGPMTDRGLIAEACEVLKSAAPDVLLLGGDFVEYDARQIDWMAPLLGDVPAPAGRYAVPGNHDRWTDMNRITGALRRSGIEMLVNQSVRLPEPYHHVWICGLDDPLAGGPEPAATLGGAAGTRILLMHSPSGLADVGSEHFDLALCGHTHGGQVALPRGIPIVVPEGRLCRKYARGRFDVGGGRTMLVSCGIGCSGVPLRLFANPEILVCEVREERKSSV